MINYTSPKHDFPRYATWKKSNQLPIKKIVYDRYACRLHPTMWMEQKNWCSNYILISYNPSVLKLFTTNVYAREKPPVIGCIKSNIFA